MIRFAATCCLTLGVATAALADDPCTRPFAVSATTEADRARVVGEGFVVAFTKLGRCGWDRSSADFDRLAALAGDAQREDLFAALIGSIVNRPDVVATAMRRTEAGSPDTDRLRASMFSPDEIAPASRRIDDALPQLVAYARRVYAKEHEGLAELEITVLSARALRRGDIEAARNKIAAANPDANDPEFRPGLDRMMKDATDSSSLPAPNASAKWILDPSLAAQRQPTPLFTRGDALRARGDRAGALRWWLVQTRAGIASGESVAPLYLLLRETYGDAKLRAEWTRAEATIHRDDRSAGWTFAGVALPLPNEMLATRGAGAARDTVPLLRDDLLKLVRASEMHQLVFGR